MCRLHYYSLNYPTCQTVLNSDCDQMADLKASVINGENKNKLLECATFVVCIAQANYKCLTECETNVRKIYMYSTAIPFLVIMLV